MTSLPIRDALFKTDPYEGFTPDDGLNITGWNSYHPIFAKLAQRRPRFICEVGAWKGASAINMANLNQHWLQELVCVDTWLGSVEFWTEDTRYADLRIKNGRPDVYQTFMSNVVNSGLTHLITPFPATSLIAAELFRQKVFIFDMVYIDASHDTSDVIADITAWSRLTKVLLGDDYDWPSVRAAVHEMAKQQPDWQLSVIDEKWLFEIP